MAELPIHNPRQLSQGSCWYQEPGTYGIDYLDVWLHGYYTEDLPF